MAFALIIEKKPKYGFTQKVVIKHKAPAPHIEESCDHELYDPEIGKARVVLTSYERKLFFKKMEQLLKM